MTTDFLQEWASIGITIAKREDLEEEQEHYQAFLCYAFQYGADRTAKVVAEKTGYKETEVRIWKNKYLWDERVAEVDASKWLKEFAEREEAVKEDNRLYVQVNRKIKEGITEVSQKMLSIAKTQLNKMDLPDEVVQQNDWVITEDGRSVPTTIIYKNGYNFKPTDIIRMVESIAKNMRAVNDLPTEVVENFAPQNLDLASMSLDELEAIRRENQKELAGVTGIQRIDKEM